MSLSIVRLAGLVSVASALGCGSTSAPPVSAPAVVEAVEEPAEGQQEALDAILRKLDSGQVGSVLFWPTDERRVAFKHMEALMPARRVAAGEEPYPLAEAPLDLDGVEYRLGGETHTVGELVGRSACIGLIVVQDDTVLFEHYASGNDRDTRWVSFSITKSVTSMLIGAAIQDGFIESVEEPVVHYLPRLRGSAYEGATIENVLQMASGVEWNEDYGDPTSDVVRAGAANGLALTRYLARLDRAHEPGSTFNYNTGETNLAGDILRAAIGNNASTYLSHKIWRTFGMESDASWLLGSPGGGETGGCCLSATLRDYARIGLFAMNGGRLRDGTRVLPEGWMDASTARSRGAPFYGYLWWLGRDESYRAIGIFGQRIVVDAANNLVIAAQSNADAAVGTEYERHLDGAVAALRVALAKE
ncbi:MAG: serine hydrolase domain-containing protein [Planctomycetota bacterium]